jgi:hypothetical protein
MYYENIRDSWHLTKAGDAYIIPIAILPDGNAAQTRLTKRKCVCTLRMIQVLG